MTQYDLTRYDFNKILTVQKYRQLMSEIDYDLGHEVYDKFPKVKHQFEKMYLKMQKCVFVKNSEMISGSDILLLVDNDYLKL